MPRNRRRNRSRRPLRLLVLSMAISAVLVGRSQAQTSPFVRRGADPGAQAAAAAQQQGLQSAAASKLAQKSLQAFQRAAQARQSLDAVQAAARAAAQASQAGVVPDGLGKGGLQLPDGAIIDPGAVRNDDPRLGQRNVWLGARAPTQQVVGGDTQVTIQQTQKKAILNWETFNVGSRTRLQFDQSAGGSDAAQWIALNRVNDPSAAPSKILGSIQAPGQVYLLNRNGVLFGGASQVNAHSLLVSSLDLFDANRLLSDQTFLNRGLFGVAGQTGVVLTGLDSVAAGQTPGDIRIDSGARIASGSQGYTLIAAPNVSNAGTVTAQDGQAMLAAVLGLRKSQELQTLLGTSSGNSMPLGFSGFFSPTGDRSAVGTLDNSGIVAVTRGNATLAGYSVQQRGLVQATTSISRPGSAMLLAINQESTAGGDALANYKGGALELAPGSVTATLPEHDGETTTSSSAADLAFLGPRMILAGAQVQLREQSLTFAPGGTVNLIGLGSEATRPQGRPQLNNRLMIDSGAQLDVSGIADVQQAMSSNLVQIPRVGQNELADAPLQRDGALFRQALQFDRRASGVREDGQAWVGSPLLNAQGYVDQVPRSIDEMLLDGGTINIGARDLVIAPGAQLNMDGGYVHMLGGMVETPRLLGADGRLYDLASADPSLRYLGVAGTQTVAHTRWGVSEQFRNPLLGSRRYYESDYLHGGDAGALNIELGRHAGNNGQEPGLALLEGDLSAQALAGRYQRARGTLPQGGALRIDSDIGLYNATIGLSVNGDIDREQRSWTIVDAAAALPQGLAVDTPADAVPDSAASAQERDNPLFWSRLSTRMVNGSGLQTVAIGNAPVIEVAAGAEMQVADGGTISLQARRLEIDGALTAHAGKIALQSSGGFAYAQDPRQADDGQQLLGRGDLLLGAGARLDVSGRWTNDDRRFGAEAQGSAFVDGGSIALDALQARLTDTTTGQNSDQSASLLIAPGAVLDASSGGYVDENGALAMRDGRPLGHGGDIALHTYVRPSNESAGSPTYTADAPVADGAGRLQFDPASLRADNFAGGGTLSLRAFGVQIGGAAPSDARVLHLDAGFFADNSFGSYDLAAEQDATIAAGTQLRVGQRNLLPNLQALRGAASGSAVVAGAAQAGGNGYATLGQLDPFYRPATDFALRGGDFLGRVAGNPSLSGATGRVLLDEGAQLLLDPGASVRIGGRGQVEVLGGIQAQGGSIVVSGDTSRDSGLSAAPDVDRGPAYAAPGKAVWLGADSRLDVSGIALLDPQAALQPGASGLVRPRSGRVLGGGHITLSNDSGAIVVADGAQLDLAGTTAVLDLPTGNAVIGAGDTLQAQTVGSAGGRLDLAASTGLYFDGSIRAGGGSAQDRGGTLALLPLKLVDGSNQVLPGPSGVIFTQHDSRLPQGAQPGAPLPNATATPGPLYFAADRLHASGIDTLLVGDQSPTSTLRPQVPVGFAGDVDLSLARALVFNAPRYALLADGATGFGDLADSGQVTLSAAYVGLNGWQSPNSAAAVLAEPQAPGATTLTVNAAQIDLGGQFALDGVGEARLSSSGALRFHTPAAYAYLLDANGIATPRAGELLTAGNLTFSAAQLYPASGETFLVRALGALGADGTRADTSIHIQAQGDTPALPLSAGGTLALDATRIAQDGRLRAPSGRLLLGVGASDDAAARAVFGNRALTPTREVSLGAGSLTSVSLEGATLPYGSTVDGAQWRYDGSAQGSNTALGAPPQKQIRLDADSIALAPGARVDLSGGGDLQASEWVPGTGGSRDLLSSTNTSYASGSAAQVPLYPDGRTVYAIVPGVQTPVAASDAAFERNGGTPALGSAVHLSGVPGLADGDYTLLPAKYATLPGAYRVVARSGSDDATAAQNLIAPDGTAVVAGYLVDTLSGTRSARSQLFEVQSAATWGQYSEYTRTGANAFFAAQAAGRGNAVPQLPRDGGQLILDAGSALGLGAGLSTAAASGGNAAQVDIAARALQVLGAGQTAAAGYVGVEATALNAMNAGSLLLGGTREQTSDGTRLHVTAERLRVSNDAGSALRAPELLLAAASGDDSDADSGVRVDAGSVLQAQGGTGARAAATLLVGEDGGDSGDSALLRLSSLGTAGIVRANVPDAAQARARLQIGAGALLDGGAALSLDSTGDSAIDAGALLRGQRIDASASHVRLDAQAASGEADGLVLGAGSLAQFAQARQVGLHSYGDMEFASGLDLRVSNALTLSAGRFVGDGGDVSLSADQLTFSNQGSSAAPADSVAGGGLLHLQGREVAFAGGDKQLTGFGAVAVDAAQTLYVRDRGQFDFGTRDVDLRTPLLLADAGADQTLRTGGALRLQRSGGSAGAAQPLGGRVSLVGASIDSSGLIRANSGGIVLRSTEGAVRLHDGAALDASGVASAFFGATRPTQGGMVTLQAATGDVLADASTRIDVSAVGSADAGSVNLSAAQGRVALPGRLDGHAAQGRGGRFVLDSGSAIALDPLAVQLAGSGFDGAIDLHARSGNLLLSAGNTLRADAVTLTADGGADATARDAANGNIGIAGSIDASGTQGGSIALWGRHGVAIDGQLLARGSAADKRGGSIALGSSGRDDGTLNTDYGYQNVQAGAAGTIAIGANAVLDVSGGSAGGLAGGNVEIRTPLLADGEVNVTVANGASVRGAREVGLEAYAVWSTTDASVDPNKHFDGIIDPAGWYDAQGALLAGSWTDLTGNAVAAPTTPAQVADYLTRYAFTPDSANAAHRQFYGYADDAAGTPGTLMGFVQRPGFAFEARLSNLPNLRARPGIELRNPDPTINGGEIRVMSNWNLGSGANRDQLDFRYNGNAPVLTLRAEGGVTIKASLSDGFYQLRNPFGGGGPQGTYTSAANAYQTLLDNAFNNAFISIDGLLPAPPSDLGDPDQAAQYYGQYLQLLDMLQQPHDLGGLPMSLLEGVIYSYSPDNGYPIQDYPDQPQAPSGPTSPADYSTYLASYQSYLLDMFAYNTELSNAGVFGLATLALPAAPVLGPLLPAATHNTPSLQARADNPLPLATTSLIGGDSSRYRIVAGADFASIRPDALRAGSEADVVLDGHQRYQESGKKDVLLPTVVRTGTGSIQIAAARDLRFADADAPASVYSAGQPAAGSDADSDIRIVRSDNASGTADQVVSAQANAEAAGDLLLQAGRDILGNRQVFDRDGSRTGVAGNYVGQYWWPWLQVGNPVGADGVTPSAGLINYGGFAQGVLSSGGDVAVQAGRDIRELSVSLPTSYRLTAQGRQTYGGGDLQVDAGRDVLGGDYFVAHGQGSLNAGGNLGSAFTLRGQGYNEAGTLLQVSSAVDPVFALQDGQWAIHAGGDASLGAIVNPSYVLSSGGVAALMSDTTRATTDYGSASAIAIDTLNGDVRLGTLKLPAVLFGNGARDTSRGTNDLILTNGVFDDVLPARVDAVAHSGSLQFETGGRLYPSAQGQLEAMAQGDIRLFNDTLVAGKNKFQLAMLDETGNYDGNDASAGSNAQLDLHRNDAQPVRIYSRDGDVVSGYAADGFMLNPLTLQLPKPADIRAGRDVVNLDLRAQNYRASDVTRVQAGRDIYYTPILGGPVGDESVRWGWMSLDGPGTFEVEAGRNLGPLTSAEEAMKGLRIGLVDRNAGGIRTTSGADLVVRYGVANGEDADALAALYLDPGSQQNTDTYQRWLVEFVLQHAPDTSAPASMPLAQSAVAMQDTLTPAEAWRQFAQLPTATRRLLSERVFLDVLKQVGEGYANPASPDFQKYTRGYAAIEALFPARLGYTRNNLEGGANGAATRSLTGTLDMRGSTLQTQAGGDIRILGPGGALQVGSVLAPPVVTDSQGNVLIGPAQQGILAVGQGDIGVFTDASVLLAQSRIFTQRGGDLTLWSSNGDINAGKGSKTSAERARARYLCDQDQYCVLDASGQVSGAGIATLRLNADDPRGNAVLVAPRGTVDAGDAGIRAAGNLIVAAQFVANADNIQVQGDTVGVGTARNVDGGALSAASNAAAAVSDAVGDLASRGNATPREAPSVITVQVVGFGDCKVDDPRCQPGP
ncbi:filamentous hemagglutinin family protein [Xanthomonas sp. AM6]|uniref:filamentous haemagglutinin family protein n=1 Tax=Xanthomonas sp. AM6 TaxID=2982531 RepID=UPI0021D7F2F2|nr:filamentous haemagglutinin family protein [Xanthomonas sp. AM6]UYB52753.1 filamentous hemagglutinin family protein [Xanthomonas sp. AM6]